MQREVSVYSALIKQRFQDVRYVVAVCSGKGGVGKTFTSVCLSQALRDLGYNVGLLDLDVHGFSTHRLLALDISSLHLGEEEKPLQVKGLYYFSPAVLVQERALPVRGHYREKTVLDMLCAVQWPKLDFLIIDMPPGMGDEVVLPLRFLKTSAQVLIVTTRDPVAHAVVSRLIETVQSLGVRIVGVVYNFADLYRGSEMTSLPVLAEIPLLHCVLDATQRGVDPYEHCSEIRQLFRQLAEKLVRQVS